MTHIPVLLDEIILTAQTQLASARFYFDGTFGRGGHAKALKKCFPEMVALAFDKDLEAVEAASSMTEFSSNFKIWHEDFSNFKSYLNDGFRPYLGDSLFDLILIDLGVSSPQLDQPARGFSFYSDGPLDMRMNQMQQITAAHLVNEWQEEELVDLFREYGELRSPQRVVNAILKRRDQKPFATTLDLAQLIESTDGWRKKGKHPATQYFLALRMKVNEELSRLEQSISNLIEGLRPEGLLMVISFHSLEDRIIKNLFKNSPDQGEPVHKKVIQPSWHDTKKNPRARSAKLRVFKKKGLS